MSTRGRGFTYRHIVGFEETNLVGNVYFARHIAWQGRCRELFLREYAPSILEQLSGGVRLVTLRASCEYFEDVKPFDTVEVLMRLAHFHQNRIGLDFEYRRVSDDAAVLVSQGFQEVCCVQIVNGAAVTVAPPSALEKALRQYSAPAAQ
jgi:enediyne biosynthesis thioesterase